MMHSFYLYGVRYEALYKYNLDGVCLMFVRSTITIFIISDIIFKIKEWINIVYFFYLMKRLNI
jgi:hypothetical protein